MGWIEVGLIAGAIWLLRAYFAPFKDCGRCKGKRTNWFTRLFGLKKRRGICGKCGGTGSVQVRGSKAVHRAVRSMRTARGNRKGN